ncbi:hypothetical protein [Pseudogemmobacter humi]|uniref:Uncharacterized protein n=1 Tax=Pseudogemmobacter humi TaxID=2483812 RepID=A0A3P5XA85_9RHOB|nr:hypothetical protein [Pseudogemmobacter humi]VDC31529.1 hypothetical protein XINFAN_02929 [Pseudogemmobacter humi]
MISPDGPYPGSSELCFGTAPGRELNRVEVLRSQQSPSQCANATEGAIIVNAWDRGNGLVFANMLHVDDELPPDLRPPDETLSHVAGACNACTRQSEALNRDGFPSSRTASTIRASMVS